MNENIKALRPGLAIASLVLGIIDRPGADDVFVSLVDDALTACRFEPE